MLRLRPLLILGRVSNLPTAWSNCLAGWWLGGGENLQKVPLLLAGTTLLYVGGTCLNDVFDVDFDRQYRKERPIPSGAISLKSARRFGLCALALGAICLIDLGITAGTLGLLLLLTILIYDAVHKATAVSPLLLGFCRFFVYLIAASVPGGRVSGVAVWCGLGLMAYVVGLSIPARVESTSRRILHWPLVLLAAPVMLAMLLNSQEYRKPALLLSALLAIWIIRSVWPALQSGGPAVGSAVSGLLAGIVLVDLLAVADLFVRLDAPLLLVAVFPLLFVVALLFQRLVPPT